MRAVALSEGLRGGAVLVVAAVALGIAGLSATFAWIPEVPLLAAFILVPVAVLGVTGYRAGSRVKRPLAGALAGAVAGAAGGSAGGLTYMAFGKPAINVLVGFVAGALGGVLIGAIGARLAAR